MLGPRSARVAAARKLLRRSARRAQRLVLIEGPSGVSAAVQAGLVRELFATEAAGQKCASLIEAARAAGAPCHLVTDEAAAALSETVTPQGIVAVVPLPQIELAQVLAAPRPHPLLAVVLVDARDPGNAGTVIRTADAAGAGVVVLAGHSVDPWSGKCVRASAGSVLHLPIVDGVEAADAIDELKRAGCRVIGADGHAAWHIYAQPVTRALLSDHAWVFGNEAHGLPPLLLDSTDIAASVPVYGQAESLNLAAAAAVCLYESARVARSAQPVAEAARGVVEEVRG